MQQEVALDTIQAHGTLSGYIYLNIPIYICRAFNVLPKSKFTIVFADGKIMLKQEIENGNAQLGLSSAKAK